MHTHNATINHILSCCGALKVPSLTLINQKPQPLSFKVMSAYTKQLDPNYTLICEPKKLLEDLFGSGISHSLT